MKNYTQYKYYIREASNDSGLDSKCLCEFHNGPLSLEDALGHIRDWNESKMAVACRLKYYLVDPEDDCQATVPGTELRTINRYWANPGIREIDVK